MRSCDEVIEQQQRPRLHRRRQPPRPRGEAAAANDEQRQPTDHQVIITTPLQFLSFCYPYHDRNRSSVVSFLVQERKRLEKDRHRSIAGAGGRSQHWRPSLQSITELSS